MQYVILSDNSDTDLANQVLLLIGDGWEPLGGIAVSHYVHSDCNIDNQVSDVGSMVCLYQAMIKK